MTERRRLKNVVIFIETILRSSDSFILFCICAKSNLFSETLICVSGSTSLLKLKMVLKTKSPVNLGCCVDVAVVFPEIKLLLATFSEH